ncbi:hypothetical protein EDB80DRAFT_342226 [Ilyonectria destructans]|nr:hypothetical protein EDB80DRAFT_342226 [Ilyonectria destructans]
MCFRPMLLGCFLFASTQIGWLSDGGMAPPHCVVLHNRMPVAEFSYVVHLRDTLGGGHNVASTCCVCGMPDHIKHSPAQFTHSHPFAHIHSHTHALSLHLTRIHSLHIPCYAMLCHAILCHPSHPVLSVAHRKSILASAPQVCMRPQCIWLSTVVCYPIQPSECVWAPLPHW